MYIQNVNNFNIDSKKRNFQGKFIKLDKFTPTENSRIDKFIKFSLNNITNEKLIKKKPYDIFVLKNNKGVIEFKTYMESTYVEPMYCYIDTLRQGKNEDEINTKNFRNSIEWYENYKKEHNGYNGFWEKIKSFFKSSI